MTYRLIALMSAVLLLSLAAFALLMNHFQAGVMSELEKTVSIVGRETIRSLEGPSFHFRLPEPPARAHATETKRMVIRHESGKLLISEEGKPDQVIDLPDPVACGAASELVTTPVPGGGEHVVMVQLEDVRAEGDLDKGLLLRIPTKREGEVEWTRAGGERGRAGGDPQPGQRTILTQVGVDVRSGPGASGTGQLTEREIVLPIPTAHYQDLFAATRKKSILLFLCVLALGMALSAAVASRFTRPIRKLDLALHRLAEGDLEATVEVRGRDEVSRLGRAFNEMARRLRAARDQARDLGRREKLSALGRLAAGVAHDVRNPLHSIGLTLQHLQETCRPADGDRGGEFDRSVEIIRGEIRRLDRLVTNFLRFTRAEGRERVPVDLGELLRDVARLVEKEAERRCITLTVEAEGTAPRVIAEAEAVRSSVLNLVLNSFEAMAEGGRLALRLRALPGEVRIEVGDTGPGIPESEQDRVFEFAYTTRPGGSGLGLAMVHQVVVEDHGGRVDLKSRPGEGTEVTLSFPLGAPQSLPA